MRRAGLILIFVCLTPAGCQVARPSVSSLHGRRQPSVDAESQIDGAEPPVSVDRLSIPGDPVQTGPEASAPFRAAPVAPSPAQSRPDRASPIAHGAFARLGAACRDQSDPWDGSDALIVPTLFQSEPPDESVAAILDAVGIADRPRDGLSELEVGAAREDGTAYEGGSGLQGSIMSAGVDTPAGCDESPISVYDDLWCSLPRLGRDARGVVNWNNAAILGVALGGALVVRSELDGSVRENTARHPDRWGGGSRGLGKIGEAPYQIPVLLGAYAWTVYRQDQDGHDMMSSMISAYTITGLSTIAIKAIANTSRPSDTWNGGQFGFPSFHTASTFAVASVLDEYEGHLVGVPAYIVAGLVGWSRIDTRDHDLSDVVFGAALGYVIGKSVSGRALDGDSRVHVLPYTHPTDGSPGLLLDTAF